MMRENNWLAALICAMLLCQLCFAAESGLGSCNWDSALSYGGVFNEYQLEQITKGDENVTGCPMCALVENFTFSYMNTYKDEASTPNYIELAIYYENWSAKPLRQPVENDPVIVFVDDHTNALQAYRMYTASAKDSGLFPGIAKFDLTPYLSPPPGATESACYDFYFVTCPFTSGCGFQACLDATGLTYDKNKITKLEDLPLMAGAVPSGAPTFSTKKEYVNEFLPATDTMNICPPPKAGTNLPGFCLPLFLILGMLMGAMYYSGKNPLGAFDISAPRLGRHMRYQARARSMLTVDVMSIVQTARSVSSSVKEMKGQKAGAGTQQTATKGGQTTVGMGTSMGLVGMIRQIASGKFSAKNIKAQFKAGPGAAYKSAFRDMKGVAAGSAKQQLASQYVAGGRQPVSGAQLAKFRAQGLTRAVGGRERVDLKKVEAAAIPRMAAWDRFKTEAKAVGMIAFFVFQSSALGFFADIGQDIVKWSLAKAMGKAVADAEERLRGGRNFSSGGKKYKVAFVAGRGIVVTDAASGKALADSAIAKARLGVALKKQLSAMAADLATIGRTGQEAMMAFVGRASAAGVKGFTENDYKHMDAKLAAALAKLADFEKRGGKAAVEAAKEKVKMLAGRVADLGAGHGVAKENAGIMLKALKGEVETAKKEVARLEKLKGPEAQAHLKQTRVILEVARLAYAEATGDKKTADGIRAKNETAARVYQAAISLRKAEGDVNDAQAQIAGAKFKIAKLEKEMPQMKQDLSGLEARVSQAKGELADVENKLANVPKELQGSTDAKLLETRRDALSSEIKDKTTQATSIKERIEEHGAMQMNMGAAETRLAQAKNEIAQVQSTHNKEELALMGHAAVASCMDAKGRNDEAQATYRKADDALNNGTTGAIVALNIAKADAARTGEDAIRNELKQTLMGMGITDRNAWDPNIGISENFRVAKEALENDRNERDVARTGESMGQPAGAEEQGQAQFSQFLKYNLGESYDRNANGGQGGFDIKKFGYDQSSGRFTGEMLVQLGKVDPGIQAAAMMHNAAVFANATGYTVKAVFEDDLQDKIKRGEVLSTQEKAVLRLEAEEKAMRHDEFNVDFLKGQMEKAEKKGDTAEVTRLQGMVADYEKQRDAHSEELAKMTMNMLNAVGAATQAATTTYKASLNMEGWRTQYEGEHYALADYTFSDKLKQAAKESGKSADDILTGLLNANASAGLSCEANMQKAQAITNYVAAKTEQGDYNMGSMFSQNVVNLTRDGFEKQAANVSSSLKEQIEKAEKARDTARADDLRGTLRAFESDQFVYVTARGKTGEEQFALTKAEYDKLPKDFKDTITRVQMDADAALKAGVDLKPPPGTPTPWAGTAEERTAALKTIVPDLEKREREYKDDVNGLAKALGGIGQDETTRNFAKRLEESGNQEKLGEVKTYQAAAGIAAASAERDRLYAEATAGNQDAAKQLKAAEDNVGKLRSESPDAARQFDASVRTHRLQDTIQDYTREADALRQRVGQAEGMDRTIAENQLQIAERQAKAAQQELRDLKAKDPAGTDAALKPGMQEVAHAYENVKAAQARYEAAQADARQASDALKLAQSEKYGGTLDTVNAASVQVYAGSTEGYHATAVAEHISRQAEAINALAGMESKVGESWHRYGETRDAVDNLGKGKEEDKLREEAREARREASEAGAEFKRERDAALKAATGLGAIATEDAVKATEAKLQSLDYRLSVADGRLASVPDAAYDMSVVAGLKAAKDAAAKKGKKA